MSSSLGVLRCASGRIVESGRRSPFLIPYCTSFVRANYSVFAAQTRFKNGIENVKPIPRQPAIRNLSSQLERQGKLSVDRSSFPQYEGSLGENGEKGVMDQHSSWIPSAQFNNSALCVRFGNGWRIYHSFIHLRDSCSCSQCVDPSSKQRGFQTSDIPLDIYVRSFGEKDGKIMLRWENDVLGYDSDHSSIFSKEDLLELNQKPISRPERAGRTRIPWDKQTFERDQHWISFHDYMNDESKFRLFMRSLFRYGLVFVKDVPDSSDMIEKIATRMGPLRNSFYGLTWDVRSVPNAKNVAYTNKFLNFHMDLLYMADPPGFQLLHCLRNSFSGGESLFADTFQAARVLAQRNPEFYLSLLAFPVRYGYPHKDQRYEYTRPTIELVPKSLQKEGDLLGNIAHVNYSPPFQVPFRKTGSPTWNERFENYIRASRAFAAELSNPDNMFESKLRPGECVIFANRRVVHARRGFNLSNQTGDSAESSGERWLRGAYVDEDALLSRFEILRSQDPEGWDLKYSEE